MKSIQDLIGLTLANVEIKPAFKLEWLGAAIEISLGSLKLNPGFEKISNPAILISPLIPSQEPQKSVSTAPTTIVSTGLTTIEARDDGSYELPEGIRVTPISLHEEGRTWFDENKDGLREHLALFRVGSRVEGHFRNFTITSERPSRPVADAILSSLSSRGLPLHRIKRSDLSLIKVSHPGRASVSYFLAPPPQRAEPPIRERLLTITRRHTEEGVPPETHNYQMSWPPDKLGDGSFGTVYRVTDLNSPPVSYAMKILYARQANMHRVMDPETGDGAAPQRSPTQNVRQSGVHPDASALTALRFQYEREIANTLRRSFEKRKIDGDLTDYVCPRDFTDEFRLSAAATTTEKYYETLGRETNFSNYAIVMDYCDVTLKDLLEKQYVVMLSDGDDDIVISEDLSLGYQKKCMFRLGYQILGQLPYDARIRVSLPFLQGLCIGLSLLHGADPPQSHHDLKPANIFVKFDSLRLKVKLGDFSFVAPAVKQGTNVAFLLDAISTGTVHFRSPEQKDFADVCEGIIMHEVPDVDLDMYAHDHLQTTEDGDERNRSAIDKIDKMIKMRRCFFIRIRDPKFAAGEIKGGDLLVFPADRRGVVRDILTVVRSQYYSDIWLDVDLTAKAGKRTEIGEEKSGGSENQRSQLEELRDRFADEEKTQITIYRVPGRRSDIFGFGSVFFDLMTGGASPEEFYERLRVLDVPRRVGESGGVSIKELMSVYRRFTQVTSREELGGLAERYVFSAFAESDGGQRRYAPEWAVEIILKCMMYHASDNLEEEFRKFHSENTDAQMREARIYSPIDLIYGTLLDKMRELRADDSINNLLVNPDKSEEWDKVLRLQFASELSGASGTGAPATAAGEERRSLWRRLR